MPHHRCAGGVGYDDPTFVEYDLDSEDEKWLKVYNENVVRAAGCLRPAACPPAQLGYLPDVAAPQPFLIETRGGLP